MSEEKRVKLVYVAGPYSATAERTVEYNVKAARAVARLVAAAHPLLFPVVPHQLGAGVEDLGDYDWWIAGTLKLMSRCDALVLVAGWEESRGARAEREVAIRLGMPVFDAESVGCVEALRDFVSDEYVGCAKCGRRAKCARMRDGTVYRPSAWDFPPGWSLVGTCRDCSHDAAIDAY